jgi:hypothetical protein
METELVLINSLFISLDQYIQLRNRFHFYVCDIYMNKIGSHLLFKFLFLIFRLLSHRVNQSKYVLDLAQQRNETGQTCLVYCIPSKFSQASNKSHTHRFGLDAEVGYGDNEF